MPKQKDVPTPKPIAARTICDVCGLDWSRHGKDATAEECIRLLKADLASAEIRAAQARPSWPYPWIITTNNPCTTTNPGVRELPHWESGPTTFGQIEGPR